MNISEATKEVVKWAIGAIILVIVFFAAMYWIAGPMVQRMVAKIEEQNELIVRHALLIQQQEQSLQAAMDKQAELESVRASIEEDLLKWKVEVGSLINDPVLTRELFEALRGLRSLPSNERHFVAAAHNHSERLKALELMTPIACGYLRFKKGEADPLADESFWIGEAIQSIRREKSTQSQIEFGKVTITFKEPFEKGGMYGVLASSNYGTVSWTSNLANSITLAPLKDKGDPVPFSADVHIVFLIIPTHAQSHK